jgi:ATP-binding protein involved in chromosome partitioning
MSAGSLPDGTALDLFGSGGGAQVAAALEVPLLGQIPLSVPLRKAGDAGTPLVSEHPDDPAAIALSDAFRALQATRSSRVGSPLPVSPR